MSFIKKFWIFYIIAIILGIVLGQLGRMINFSPEQYVFYHIIFIFMAILAGVVGRMSISAIKSIKKENNNYEFPRQSFDQASS